MELRVIHDISEKVWVKWLKCLTAVFLTVSAKCSPLLPEEVCTDLRCHALKAMARTKILINPGRVEAPGRFHALDD